MEVGILPRQDKRVHMGVATQDAATNDPPYGEGLGAREYRMTRIMLALELLARGIPPVNGVPVRPALPIIEMQCRVMIEAVWRNRGDYAGGPDPWGAFGRILCLCLGVEWGDITALIQVQKK